MSNLNLFQQEKLNVFEFFNKYQNEITLSDIENIFTTLDYDFFKKLEFYVKYERENNYPIEEF